MKLTPLEIKQHQFDKSLRGFDIGEVETFLALVANEVEQLHKKNGELEEQIQGLNKRITHYEKVEQAMHETLQTTKESVTQKMEQARNEAKTATDRAYMEAERITQEARQQRSSIRQEMIRLLERRDEMIQSFKHFLENNTNMVEKFAANKFHIFDPIEEPNSSVSTSNKAGQDKEDSPSESDKNIKENNLRDDTETSDAFNSSQKKESKSNSSKKMKDSTSSILDDDDFMNTFLDELD
tara:strand:+ start:327 stop:1043 length:717 start_codon:yes stop_codon:yes gene_type:complete